MSDPDLHGFSVGLPQNPDQYLNRLVVSRFRIQVILILVINLRKRSKLKWEGQYHSREADKKYIILKKFKTT